MEPKRRLLRRIRWLLGAFAVGLVLSGLTALPLEWEIDTLCRMLGIAEGPPAAADGGLRYWLAFAHIMIAVAFVGPLRDPVRNVWVITFGLIACAAVIPTAMVFGPIRGIPLPWRLIDCAFGVVGIVPLLLARRDTLRLAALRS